MRRGFTLVELLAVIVILAVIALITIPAVMRIIDTSTTNSYRRSVDLYGKAVSQAVVSYESDMVEQGKDINVTFNNIQDYIEYEGNDVDCKDKTIYSDKTILLTECYVDEELVKAEKNKGYGDENYYYYTNSKKKAKLIKYIEAVEEVVKNKNISGICNISEDKITCNSEDIKIKSKLENAIEGNLTIENSKVKSYSNLKFETEKKVETNNEVPQVIDEQNTGNINENDNNNSQNNINNSNSGNNNQYNDTQGNNYNENVNEKYAVLINDIDNNLKVSIGDKYTYRVNDNDIFNFYVLSIDDNEVNLIMDRNICENGTYTSTSKSCLYNYYSINDNSMGPLSALQKLREATKNWKNVPNINLTYENEGRKQAELKGYNPPQGYIELKINNRGVVVKNREGKTQEIKYGNFKARLPKYSEFDSISDNNYYYGAVPYWIVENLKYFDVSSIVGFDKYSHNNSTDVNQNIWGYWILTSDSVNGSNGLAIDYRGTIWQYGAKKTDRYGIRPVITVPMSYLTN